MERPRSLLTFTSTKLWKPNCAIELTPKEGMVFDTLDLAIAFYEKYAQTCGFKPRLSTSSIGFKYIVCNREGFKQVKKKDGNDGMASASLENKRRRRLVTRVGCKARLVLKSHKEKYIVFKFHEEHNHILVSPKSKKFLNHDLTIGHKSMIVSNSRRNIGPVKTFHLIKENVGGYENVGASIEDFKNFKRDLRAFIGNSDGQIFINLLMKKKEMCSSFFFEYDLDSDGCLRRIFWADAICRRNYALFGDMFSFDATYETNKYLMIFAPFTGVDHHKRCVTFGVGLLSNEKDDSYTWLFETFLRCMSYVEPKCIITDQDPAIRSAINETFHESAHRFCMWHVMKKVKDKVGYALCNDTDFLDKINLCVWDVDLEPNEFEEKWKAMLVEFELEKNEWLNTMFEQRHMWIPAYFRDVFLASLLRTTSRSESENSFFDTFTNPFLTLVEFLTHFESAMDCQRYMQDKLNNKCNTSLPELKTPLPIENQATQVYTHNVFYDIQYEIYDACFKCAVIDIMKNGDVETRVIFDGKKKREVILNTITLEVLCTCKLFERKGILCKHALSVYKDKGVCEIPTIYILDRWTKDALKKPLYDIHGNLLDEVGKLNEEKRIYGKLWNEMFSCMHLVNGDIEDMSELLDILTKFKENVISRKENSKEKSKVDEMESLLGCSIPNEINVLPPKQSKTKGTGKRYKSTKEQIVEKEKKKRNCKSCGELTTHDSRNCPEKMVDPKKR